MITIKITKNIVPPPSSSKYRYFFISTLALSLLENPVYSADECGTGSTVVCSSSNNPYASGIKYTVNDEFTLNIESGVEIDRPLGTDVRGIEITGNSSDAVTVNIADNVKIQTQGKYPGGVYLIGSGPLSINSGANIDIAIPSNLEEIGGGKWGLQASLVDAAGVDDVSIVQRSGSTITTSGADTGGLYGTNHGLGGVKITTDGTIELTDSSTFAVNATSWNPASTGIVSITQGSTGYISINGEDSLALYSLNYGLGETLVETRGTLESFKTYSDAILAYAANTSSQADVIVRAANTANILTKGDNSNGVSAIQSGLGDVHIISSAKISTEGGTSHALVARIENSTSTGSASIVLDSSLLSTTGNASHGAYATTAGPANASITMGAGTSVIVSGAESVGAYASTTGNASIITQGRLNASGEFGVGAAAISEADAASLTVEAGSLITGGWQANTNDLGSSTNFAAAGAVLGSATGSTLLNMGTINAGSDRAVLDTGRSTAKPGSLTIDNHGLLSGFVELSPGGQNNLNNHNGATIELRHFADTDGDGVRDTKRVAVSDFGSSTSTFTNSAGATVRLAPTGAPATFDNSFFYIPTTGIDKRSLPADVYAIERDGIVQAQLTNLGEFRNAGVIDLRGSQIGNTLLMTGAASATSAPGTNVFVSEGGQLLLRGGGLSASLNDPTKLFADMLIVDSTRLGAGGPTRIQLDYNPATMGVLTSGNGMELVEVRDATRSAAGAFVLGNRIAAGAYEYTLQQGGVASDTGDGNWYLRSHLNMNSPEQPTPETPTPPPTPVVEVPNYRNEVPTAMVVPALAHRLGLGVLGTYHDRAGEDNALLAQGSALQGYARATESPEEKRSWGRVFGETGKIRNGGNDQSSRYQSFSDKGARYDFDFYGFQLGLDLHRQLNDDGSRNIGGVYLGLSHAKADVDGALQGRAGEVTMDGYSLGAYWTLLGASRWYIDAVAQATLYEGIEARSTANEKIKPSGWGYTASLEAGYPFALKGNWTLEPQAQLIYQRVMLDDTERDTYGIIQFKDSDALYGRLGGRLVKQWEREGGKETSAWLRANAWHSFGADAQTSFASLNGENTVTLSNDLGGSWAQVGLGVTHQVNNNLNAFIAADYNQGLDHSNNRSLSGRVGLQYVW
ncbi:autotransporter outer membrane beta-barrel domain-containing protein [Ectopseudomonas mendocina]|uniref:Autotransporter outer membrane beta-barrel domain-containing protein n=1 Tax=Ectopseudomonas mendocina TaxID=300 RepID=A0ABZ2RKW1_ECTME